MFTGIGIIASDVTMFAASLQGLTLAHFKAQLEVLGDTMLPLELNLSTFRTHPRVNLG
jgi:hypothetical protein